MIDNEVCPIEMHYEGQGEYTQFVGSLNHKFTSARCVAFERLVAAARRFKGYIDAFLMPDGKSFIIRFKQPAHSAAYLKSHILVAFGEIA